MTAIPGFRSPTHTTIEPGCAGRLHEFVTAVGRAEHLRALVITDPGVRVTPGFDRALAALSSSSIEARIDDSVESNPRLSSAARLAARATDESIDVLVGFGGGSVLDAAKAAAMLARNPGDPRTYIGRNRFANSPLPFVAVPTTCGTGSEVTWVAVLSDPENATKVSIKGDAMFPNAAVVDADLLAGLPPHLVASTGLDALTHALEALTVNCSNPVSDALATEASLLLLQWLEVAVHEADGSARQHVARASTLAGMAFGNADVGAVHCLSESIGGIHDLPHGLLNAVLLTPVLRAHGVAVQGPLAAFARRLPGTELAAPDNELAGSFLDRVESLTRACGLPAYADLSVPHDAAARMQIAEAAAANGSNGSNPRPMSVSDYDSLLASLT